MMDKSKFEKKFRQHVYFSWGGTPLIYEHDDQRVSVLGIVRFLRQDYGYLFQFLFAFVIILIIGLCTTVFFLISNYSIISWILFPIEYLVSPIKYLFFPFSLVIVFLVPFLNALVLGLFGWSLGSRGVRQFLKFFLIIYLLNSFYLFYHVLNSYSVYVIYFGKLIESGLFDVDFEFVYDTLSVTMIAVVSFISVVVHFFSLSYMSEDPHFNLFFSILGLFTLMMLCLVMSSNFFQMLYAWEGVGLCSYLLVNFWRGRPQTHMHGAKAIFVNRVGDFFLMLFLADYWFHVNDFSLDYLFLFKLNEVKEFLFLFKILEDTQEMLLGMGLFLLLAAATKSAQIGGHVWLPDAMDGPTPVSALIHAATMVTVGIFVLNRSYLLIEANEDVKVLMMFFGGLTAFLSAICGMFAYDIKKVIAYSTCSQLGYMFAVAGMSGYVVSMFHLVTHAGFKALLFLSAGVVIHGLMGQQDIRKMGSLYLMMPFTYVMMLVGSLALMGFPFLSGFYSKEMILIMALLSGNWVGYLTYNFLLLAAFGTAYYSIRLLYFVFFSEARSTRVIYVHAHDGDRSMVICLFLLLFMAVFLGYFFKKNFIETGMFLFFWGEELTVEVISIVFEIAEFIPVWIKLFPLLLSFIGGFLGYLLSSTLISLDVSKFFRYFYYAGRSELGFDSLIGRLQIVKNFIPYFLVVGSRSEFGIYKELFHMGVVNMVRSILVRARSGIIHDYILYMTFGLCILIALINIL